MDLAIQQVLDPAGTLVGAMPELEDGQLEALFRRLVQTRTFDETSLRLQRTGRIPAYYACAGMEAHVAIPAALEDRDWVFTAYREQGVRLGRGVPEVNELALWRGMPYAIWNPLDYRITPLNATIGTHIPQTTGYGYAARMLGKNEVALAMFGDGATSEGDFHAGLNSAGVWKTPTVYFCQNNLYAQSTPLDEQTASKTLAQKALAYGIEGVRVDGMDTLAVYAAVKTAVDKARAGEGATLIESLCYRYTAHSTYDGTPVYRTREEESEWLDLDPLIRMRVFLASKGLDAEGIEAEVKKTTKKAMSAAIVQLENTPLPQRDPVYRATQRKLTPRLVEQLHNEQRAVGEEPTELPDEACLVVGNDPEFKGETEAMTLVEALNSALDHAMTARENTLILGEDVGREGGVFRVTAGLYEKYGRERMLDTPLCEIGIAGAAVGMAIAGARPVVEIEFGGFSYTSFDQIVFHIARFPWRTFGAFKMPIVIRMPGGGGHEGYEGHSDAPEAFYAHAPGGLNVIYPSNPKDAKGLLASALISDDPCVFFEPVAQYFERQEGVPLEHYEIPIGRARIAREGKDVTIVAYGNAVGIAEIAAATLEADGVSSEVIDLRTLKPWDEETVIGSVDKTGRLVVVHEAPVSGGLGAEIIATVMEKAGDCLFVPPVRVAHADMVWAPAKMEPYSMIEPSRVVQAVKTVMED
jgi:pyruvate/2-oxoglutarate/acetoin dehydrogenase E1 component/TPP-dependent pyruvate/acetoin dehydrogenase alpha subunit